MRQQLSCLRKALSRGSEGTSGLVMLSLLCALGSLALHALTARTAVGAPSRRSPTKQNAPFFLTSKNRRLVGRFFRERTILAQGSTWNFYELINHECIAEI